MKDTTLTALRQSGAGFLPPVGILVAAGILLSIDLRGPARLSASVTETADSDGDGLVDKQEKILGTLPSVADTDHDGFGDAEELARKTSPIFSQIYPDTGRIDVGMTCRGEKDRIHVLVAVYLPDGNLDSADVNLGMLIGGRVFRLRGDFALANATIDFVPGSAPHSAVALIDIPISRRWVYMLGQFTLFATAGRSGTGIVTSADKVQLVRAGGVVVYVMPDPAFLHIPLVQAQSPHSTGTIYVPLSDGGDAPLGWTPGAICYQTSQAVAISGAVVTQEVVTAECQSGWEGYCPPDCSSSAGSTFTTIDPVILIGG